MIISGKVLLNSSPIDERWEMVPRKLVGPDTIEGKAGRYPWQPSEREPPLQAATNGHRHTDSVSGNLATYLIPYLPKPQLAKRVGGVGARFHNALLSELGQHLPRFATDALA